MLKETFELCRKYWDEYCTVDPVILNTIMRNCKEIAGITECYAPDDMFLWDLLMQLSRCKYDFDTLKSVLKLLNLEKFIDGEQL